MANALARAGSAVQGATPGQLSLANDPGGRLSLAPEPGQLSVSDEEES